MELLAPAGSPERLMAALEAGADAVYLGGKQFSARKFAGNFSREEMESAVHTCHILGVSVYVTLNTLIADSEWDELEEYLRFLGSLRIDGLLVQDLGVARAAHRLIPEVPLHASTQMTVSNLDGVNFLRSLHFTRVVLSREVSLAEMKAITAGTDLEIEVFVHGALCVCYSGQCLMSSFIGGRSGNRGACAQPCRMPYTLTDDAGRAVPSRVGSYILSLKDMTGIDRIRALAEAGVMSLKIEGRMKSPEYVYQVVSAYRKALDAFAKGQTVDTDALLLQMKEQFNRGYTHGFYDRKIGRSMITGYAPGNHGIPAGHVGRIQRGRFFFTPEAQPEKAVLTGVSYITAVRTVAFVPAEDVRFQTSGEVCVPCKERPEEQGRVYWHIQKEEQHLTLKSLHRKVPVYMSLSARPGLPIRLEASDGEGQTVTVSSEMLAEAARNRVTTEEEAAAQLGRLGNTYFSLVQAEVRNEGCMLPKSVLNHLRQEAVEKLGAAREEAFLRARRKQPEEEAPAFRMALKDADRAPRLVVRTDQAAQAIDAIRHGAGGLVFGGESFSHRKIPLEDYQKVLACAREKGVPVTFASPRVVREKERAACRQEFLRLAALEPDAMEIEFTGALSWAADMPGSVVVEGGSSLNLFNREGLRMARNLGLSMVWLSEELTLGQIRKITGEAAIPVGVMVYGRPEMMISEYCAINAMLGGGADKEHCPAPCLRGRYSLADEKGRRFPLRTDEYCRMHILNSSTLDMRPYMGRLLHGGISRFALDLRGTEEKAGVLCESFLRAMAGRAEIGGEPAAVTRGHFFRGVL